MDAWAYVYLVAMGFAVLMVGYDIVKWLFSGKKKEFSALAQLIISQLNYPPESMYFKDGDCGSKYYTDPSYLDKDEIETPHSVRVKRTGFWGSLNCSFQGEDVTCKLTRRELSIIDKVYKVAVNNKRKHLEKVKNKKYEDALLASQQARKV